MIEIQEILDVQNGCVLARTADGELMVGIGYVKGMKITHLRENIDFYKGPDERLARATLATPPLSH